MSAYTAGAAGLRNKTLTPGQVDVVTFTGQIYNSVQVVTDGRADIFVEFGVDADPQIGGERSWHIQDTRGSTTLPTRVSGRDLQYGSTIVKLLSAGTATYSVGVPGFVEGAPVDGGDGGGPGSNVYTFTDPGAVWVIGHDLGFDPAGLVVIDSDGFQRDGFAVQYLIAGQTLRLSFDVAIAGTAYLS